MRASSCASTTTRRARSVNLSNICSLLASGRQEADSPHPRPNSMLSPWSDASPAYTAVVTEWSPDQQAELAYGRLNVRCREPVPRAQCVRPAQNRRRRPDGPKTAPRPSAGAQHEPEPGRARVQPERLQDVGPAAVRAQAVLRVVQVDPHPA